MVALRRWLIGQSYTPFAKNKKSFEKDLHKENEGAIILVLKEREVQGNGKLGEKQDCVQGS